jgi:hypothetical protein
MKSGDSELSAHDIGVVLGVLLSAAEDYENMARRNADLPTVGASMQARADELKAVAERFEVHVSDVSEDWMRG